MKKTIKSLAAKCLPTSVFLGLEAAHNRSFIQKLERQQGYTDLNLKYEAQLGRTVLTGPFKGLQYTEFTSRRHITQRLLGCYESELHPVFDECIQTSYNEIYDIGCAEGYYAVGLALKANCNRIHAFDTDPWARKACKLMASLNGVEEKLTIHGFCSVDWMNEHLQDQSLVISDCEGFESVLFAKENCLRYANCDLLIELHDEAPSLKHEIVRNFADTHVPTIIPSRPHVPADYPQIAFLSEKEQIMCVDDRREKWQGWVFLKSKA